MKLSIPLLLSLALHAVLHLRTIGQHDINGQSCTKLDCIYLGSPQKTENKAR